MALPTIQPALPSEVLRFASDHGLQNTLYGDGVGDARPALQELIDSGRSFRLPSGRYRIVGVLRNGRRLGLCVAGQASSGDRYLGFTGSSFEYEGDGDIFRVSKGPTALDFRGSRLSCDTAGSEAWKTDVCGIRINAAHATIHMPARIYRMRDGVRIEHDSADPESPSSATYALLIGGRIQDCRFGVRVADRGPSFVNGVRVVGTTVTWGDGAYADDWDHNSSLPWSDPNWTPYAAGFHIMSSALAENNGVHLDGVAVEYTGGSNWPNGGPACRGAYLDGGGITLDLARSEGANVIHCGPNSLSCRVGGGLNKINWIDESTKQNRRDTRNANHVLTPEDLSPNSPTANGTQYDCSDTIVSFWEGRV